MDDAAGEASTRPPSCSALGYPGGPQLAGWLNRRARALPTAAADAALGDLDFSFSGLKTAVLNVVSAPDWDPARMADLAAEFQQAVVEVLCAKAPRGAEEGGA